MNNIYRLKALLIKKIRNNMEENVREKFKEVFSIFDRNSKKLTEIEKEYVKKIEFADMCGIKEDSIKYRETLLRNSINFLLSSYKAIPIMKEVAERESTFLSAVMEELIKHCEAYINLTKKSIELLNSDIFDLTYGENPSVEDFLKIINQNK